MGRPEKYDRKQIALDLIAWAKQDDSINLCKFCCLHDPIIPPPYLSEWAKEDKDFSEAYRVAKSFLGFRREEKLNRDEMHVKAYDLNAKTYDFFLNEQAQATSAFESSLKQKEAESSKEKITPEQIAEAIRKSKETNVN
jgi:hypothetical protein